MFNYTTVAGWWEQRVLPSPRSSIANLTTLTYVLINLRALARVTARRAEERTARRGDAVAD